MICANVITFPLGAPYLFQYTYFTNNFSAIFNLVFTKNNKKMVSQKGVFFANTAII